ncbi:cold shock domain-containing protein [Acinetobacter sp. ANC 5378]|uniref:cold shock domain-containing protein n=1 Tax=Acinetobacter sp. ANC 5378 TaxID=2731249 RepID=UPI0014905820|nr:cold shock domain-containing protein [Acinetobacter sp. ANC 5378]NNG81380.1 cold shock domain-containing protein [Acinetobacter sp. ANC 5378]
MFVEGKIKSYIVERGFGFISMDGESKDLFFHIKDFPNKSVEPKIGEKLKFRIVEDNGKLKADQIVRLDLKQNTAALEAQPQQGSYRNHGASPRFNERSRKGRIFTIVGLIIIAVLAVLVYNKYQAYRQTQQLKAQQLMQEQAQIVEQQREALGDLPENVLSEQGQRNLEDQTYLTNKPRSEKVSASIEKQNAVQHQQSSQFKCDGRTHCSQMRSYEEAVFFLRNCPGTQMDGNNDGEPCERQFGR